MKSSASATGATKTLRPRVARRPQLERDTPIVAIAAARQVVEEASLWLGVPLHARHAAALAFRARVTYAHSPSFRTKLRRPGDAGRDTLYVFMRHWLAARHTETSPALFARLPADYAWGGVELPFTAPTRHPAPAEGLSVEARSLLG